MNKKTYQLLFIVAIIGGFLMGVSQFSGVLFYIGLVIVLIDLTLMISLYFRKNKKIKKMRTKTFLEIGDKSEEVDEFLKDYLRKNKFILINYVNDEKVYQLGNGLWTARKYLTYYFEGTKLILESWISMSFGKGISEEIPLDNKFFGKVPKNQLKKIIDEIATEIERIVK